MLGLTSNVKASIAALNVTFDQAQFVADSEVSGQVHLVILRDNVSCTSVGCRIIGRESTSVFHDGGENSSSYTVHEMFEFLNEHKILQRFESGQVQRGQYLFPFSFNLPASSNCSMSVKQSTDSCSVSYRVEAWLDRLGSSRSDIDCCALFNVVRPVPTDYKVPLHAASSREPVRSWGCFDRGQVLLGGSAESCVLQAGEMASVNYAGFNTSAVDIKAVEVELTQSVRMLASLHGVQHSGKAHSKLFHTRLTPSESQLDLTRRAYTQTQTEDELVTILDSNATQLTFRVPHTALSSCRGTLIHVTHAFIVRFITTFGSSNPSISLDVTMLNRPPPTSAANSTEPLGRAEVQRIPQTTRVSSVRAAQPTTAVTDQKGPVAHYFASWAQLVEEVGASCDPCGKVQRYFSEGHSEEELQPEHLYALFKAIAYVYDQEQVAAMLANNVTSLNCAQLARVAAATKDVCRRDIVEKLLKAAPLTDPENVHLVKAALSTAEFLTVERYFRRGAGENAQLLAAGRK